MSQGASAAAPHGSEPYPTYRPDVDGLRALAIVPVVVFHAFPTLAPGGFVGVDVFFVISGYLISSIILGGLERGRFTFREFYARRIKRIFPALVLVLAACLAWAWFALFSDAYALLGKHVAGGAGFIANFLYWDEAGYFDAASDTKPLLHLWSLGIEEQFYLVWPALLVLSWRLHFPIAFLIAILGTVSFAINVVVVRSDQVAAFYAPWTRLWELLMGSGLAVLARAPTLAPVLDVRIGRLLPVDRARLAKRRIGRRARLGRGSDRPLQQRHVVPWMARRAADGRDAARPGGRTAGLAEPAAVVAAAARVDRPHQLPALSVALAAAGVCADRRVGNASRGHSNYRDRYQRAPLVAHLCHRGAPHPLPADGPGRRAGASASRCCWSAPPAT